MASTVSGDTNPSAILQTATIDTDTKFVRCQMGTLEQLRCLNEAEVITLFTPFVPHLPSTTLAKDMDPFEPLGRALPRQVRHVPYRLDNGMTETHVGFLSASGALVIVICATTNVLHYNHQAFEQQFAFARDVSQKAGEYNDTSNIPIIMLLINNETAAPAYAEVRQYFSTLVALSDYSTDALMEAAKILFGEQRSSFSRHISL